MFHAAPRATYILKHFDFARGRKHWYEEQMLHVLFHMNWSYLVSG
jgi:hypothetical protein